MNQEIKIPVSVSTGKSTDAVGKIEDAFDSVGASVKGTGRTLDDVGRRIDAATDKAKRLADEFRKVETSAERIRATQNMLSRDLGATVSSADAERFISNFSRMRASHGIGSDRLRGFDSIENWYLGHRGTFKREADAEAHRRRVMSFGMQGTSYARSSGAPPPGGPEEPPPPPGAGAFQGGVARAQSMAMAFGKGMLALAGINSIIGMAGSAADSATEESVGLDTLKRQSGDLGISFDRLQDNVRSVTAGLGLTYVEATRLSQQFAAVRGDVSQSNIGASVRTAAGMARAFGFDPSAGVQFFGTMQRLRVAGGDDQSNRRLALMISEAIDKGGYTAKADEVLAAVSDFATQVARVTLSAPNAGAYASYLTSLTRSGLPGLDPASAAAMLGNADAAVRRGGGMGDAGLNFSYAALAHASPGLDVVSATALMSGGLFGTTASTFGPGTALGMWNARHGIRSPALNSATNFDKMRGLLRSQYGTGPFYLDAVKNYFGLSSVQQAAMLDMMSPTDLTGSGRLLAAAGLDVSKISASGIQGIARIAGAGNLAQLSPIVQDTLGRRDISDQERSTISNAFRAGDVEKLREALVRVIGTHEQEQTEGSETRQTIADLKNELTRVGTLLLGALNPIRDGVIAMAETLAPAAYRQRQQLLNDVGTDYQSQYAKRFGSSDASALASQIAKDKADYFDRKAHNMPALTLDQMIHLPNAGVAMSSPQTYAYALARRQAMARLMGLPEAVAGVPGGWRSYMGATDAGFGLPAGSTARQILAESSFDPLRDNSVTGAMGLAQVMPGTLLSLQRKLGRRLDPHNPDDALLINRMVMADSLRHEHGNLVQAYLDYGGFISPEKRNSADAASYLTKILGPDWRSYDHDRSANSNFTIGLTGEVTIPVKDQNGNHKGTASVKPFVASGPSGGASGRW